MTFGQAIATATGRWCGGAAFAATVAAWSAIPQEKLPAVQGAWSVLKAVDMVSAPPLDEEFRERVERFEDSLTDEENRRIVYWRAGHAHQLLCAVWGFAERFCGDAPADGRIDEAIRLCEKAEEWFHAKGLRDRTRHEPLRLAYGKALANHDAGLELERSIKVRSAAAGAAGR